MDRYIHNLATIYMCPPSASHISTIAVHMRKPVGTWIANLMNRMVAGCVCLRLQCKPHQQNSNPHGPVDCYIADVACTMWAHVYGS